MAPKPKHVPPMSLRAYAKRRQVSAEAVSKAVSDGRLRASVVFVDGQPKIADADAADREWDQNTRPRIDNARAPVPGRDDDEMPELSMTPGEAIARYNIARALREEAAARREAANADDAELDSLAKKGELVPVATARQDVIEMFTVVKTKILGVPSRVAQRLPHLATELEPVIDSLLREALEELADEQGDGDDEEG